MNAEGLYAAASMMTDLQKITGLNLSIDDKGNLAYDKDENTKGTSTGARDYLKGIIDNTNEGIDLRVDNSRPTRTESDGRSVYLNTTQIDNRIAGIENEGLNSLTWGFGMWFIHESMHTTAGMKYFNSNATGTIDDPNDASGLSNPGPVEEKINEYRRQLNLPQRDAYMWDGDPGNATMPWHYRNKKYYVKDTPMPAEEKKKRRAEMSKIKLK